MILIANFLIASGKIIHIILMIYVWIVIIHALLSWFQGQYSPFLYRLRVILFYLTEPVLRPFRKIIPPAKMAGIDLSPMIVILFILFVDSFLVKSMILYGQQLLSQQTLSL